MKTFLNVLYRRILYKIPLKLLLVLLAVFGILFACFSNAGLVTTNTTNLNQTFNNYVKTSNSDIMCLVVNSCDHWSSTNFKFILSTDNVGQGNAIILNYYDSSIDIDLGMGYCTQGGYMLVSTNYKCDITITEYDISEYSSMQCQTEYNLIPFSSVDQNYCTTNNLCPSCPVCPDTPVFSGDLSELYINNILHIGAPKIIMNIPDEIDWDYAYTQGGNIMNIDVVGYNVDYEKIDSIVQFQNYKPTGEDFQKIIGLLAPYTKIIVFFVFLFIVWAWIKKPFKSKKL